MNRLCVCALEKAFFKMKKEETIISMGSIFKSLHVAYMDLDMLKFKKSRIITIYYNLTSIVFRFTFELLFSRGCCSCVWTTYLLFFSSFIQNEFSRSEMMLLAFRIRILFVPAWISSVCFFVRFVSFICSLLAGRS